MQSCLQKGADTINSETVVREQARKTSVLQCMGALREGQLPVKPQPWVGEGGQAFENFT